MRLKGERMGVCVCASRDRNSFSLFLSRSQIAGIFFMTFQDAEQAGFYFHRSRQANSDFYSNLTDMLLFFLKENLYMDTVE